MLTKAIATTAVVLSLLATAPTATAATRIRDDGGDVTISAATASSMSYCRTLMSTTQLRGGVIVTSCYHAGRDRYGRDVYRFTYIA